MSEIYGDIRYASNGFKINAYEQANAYPVVLLCRQRPPFPPPFLQCARGTDDIESKKSGGEEVVWLHDNKHTAESVIQLTRGNYCTCTWDSIRVEQALKITQPTDACIGFNSVQFTSQEILLNQTFRQSAAVFFSGWEYSVWVWGS